MVPQDYYEAKKIVSKLGLTTINIDCCVNGYMLFYTEEYKALKEYNFCSVSRYNLKKVGTQKDSGEKNALLTPHS